MGHNHGEPGGLRGHRRLPAAAQRPGDAGRAADRGDRLMTATLPAQGSRPAAPRAAPPAPRAPRATPRAAARRALLATPAKLRAVISRPSSCCRSPGAPSAAGWPPGTPRPPTPLATTDERLSLSALPHVPVDRGRRRDDHRRVPGQLRSPPLNRLGRYDLDLADRQQRPVAAAGGRRRPPGRRAAPWPRLSSGLPAYSGYVAEAKSEYAMGFSLTGGSFLQVASEEAHLVLLPAANRRLHPRERRAQRVKRAGDRAV